MCPGEPPPGRLHVLRCDRLVGILPVHPDPERFEIRLESLELLLGKFLAFLDERILAEGLNVLLVLKAQLLLHARLDGQSVHVIARPVPDVLALHPVVPQIGVLENLVPGRSHVGRSVGIRRPIDKQEVLAILPVGDGLLVGINGVPVIEHTVLDRLRIVLIRDLLEPAHTHSDRLGG